MLCATIDKNFHRLDKSTPFEYCEQIMKDCIEIRVSNLSKTVYELKILPKYLEVLVNEEIRVPFNCKLPKKLLHISNGLSRIHYFQLSSRLKEVLTNDDYNYYVKTPKTVEKYRHGQHNSRPYNPSKRLKWFAIGHEYNTVIELPKNLKHFILSKAYEQKITLPIHIKHITFIPCISIFHKQNKLLLTEHMQTIQNYKHNYFLRDNLPECLIEFEVGVKVKVEIKHDCKNTIDFNKMDMNGID